MKSKYLLISLFILSHNAHAEDAASPPQGSKEVVTMVADTWCPYNCNPESPNQGFMVDLAREAFAKHNIEIEYSTMPWTRAIDETRKGMHTAIIASAPDDAPDFVFPAVSQGYMNNHLYVKSGNPWRYTGIESLKGAVLGVIEGYSYNDEFDEYIKKYRLDPSYIEVMSGDDALGVNVSMLMRGKIGVIIESKYVMNYYLSQNNLQNKIDDIASLPPSPNDNLYIAFSPKDKELSQKYANILSEETKNMRASGELQKIMDNYGLNDWGTAPTK